MTGRRLGIVTAAVAVVAVAVVGSLLIVRHGAGHGVGRSAARPGPVVAKGAPVPPQAAAATQLLVSARGRAALAPELKASLRPGRMFPPGTTFAIQRGSWHQAGSFANVFGTLRIPGHAAELAEVGLMRRGGRWLVTFEAAK